MVAPVSIFKHLRYILSVSVLIWSIGAYGQDDTQANSGIEKASLSVLSERFIVGEELIVTLRLGQFNYGEVLVVVGEKRVYVDPLEFVTVLNFPIERVNGEEAYLLKGWYISQDKSFEMRLFDSPSPNGVGEVLLSGKQAFISAEQYTESAGLQLIDMDMVGAWFGISFAFDVERLAIEMQTTTPLPAQAKLARERKKVSNRGHLIPEHPNYDFGYFGRSHQMFDANINVNYANEQFSSNYSVVGVQDLANFSTRFFVRGSDDDLLQSANAAFKRQSVNGDLLGPLNATTIEFGDIRPTRVAGTTAQQTLGLNINNQKLGQIYDFEFTNISGVIPEGWDVELYQNGILVAKDLNVNSGLYEFIDIPLFSELNRFEVVKYGPQGQIVRERVERNVDPQLFVQKPIYNITLSKANSSLINSQSQNDDEQDIFLSGDYRYAFNTWISGNFSHNINLSDGSGLYALGAVTRWSPRILTSANVSFTDKDNYGGGFGLQSRLFDQFLNASVNRSISGNDYSDTAIVRMAGELYQGDIFRLSYSNDLKYLREKNGDYSQRLGNTLTLSSRYGYLSHNIVKVDEVSSEFEDSFTSGTITLGASKGSFNTRFNATYNKNDFSNGVEWQGLEATLNYEFFNELSTQLRYGRAFATEVDSYQWSVQWEQDSYALFGTIRHNSRNDTSASLNIRFSMSEAPFGDGYLTSSQTLTNNALVAVRVFEDVNQNFLFDEGDRPLKDVKVSAQQIGRFTETDEEGIALIKGIQSFRQTDLLIDKETLDDPYLIQSTINTSLTPREGLLTLVNYPLVQGVEFEGEVYLYDEFIDKTTPFKNATVEIYNSNNALVSTLKTDFDGYFYSGILFPDRYTVRLTEESLQANEAFQTKLITVDAKKAGSFVPSVELLAQKLPYEDRFQPYIATFSNVKIAKSYLRMITKRYANYAFNQYLSMNEDKGKYFVGFASFSEPGAANNFCNTYSALFERCEVRKIRQQKNDNLARAF